MKKHSLQGLKLGKENEKNRNEVFRFFCFIV